MPGGQFSPQNREPYDERSHVEPEPSGLPDPSLLEKVLEETLAGRPTSNPEQAQELEALVQVARRHPGAALALEPIAVELVEAILRIRFSQLQLADASWRNISRDIAGTLYEDPQMQARLERFWGQLAEYSAR